MSVTDTPGFPSISDIKQRNCAPPLYPACCPSKVIEAHEEHYKKYPDHYEKCGWCFHIHKTCKCYASWLGWDNVWSAHRKHQL